MNHRIIKVSSAILSITVGVCLGLGLVPFSGFGSLSSPRSKDERQCINESELAWQQTALTPVRAKFGVSVVFSAGILYAIVRNCCTWLPVKGNIADRSKRHYRRCRMPCLFRSDRPWQRSHVYPAAAWDVDVRYHPRPDNLSLALTRTPIFQNW